MKPLFLFLRPPRPVWPFNGPGTAFWPPLAFASLAAALRDANLGIQVAVIDAPVLKMGWASTEREIARLRPAFVAIGEEAVSCADTLRAARLAKKYCATVIAGGCFFSHVAVEAITTSAVDVVVHGEAEHTIVQLTSLLLNGGDLRSVVGITFRDGDQVASTGSRKLIDDLDTLPFPAYDLLPVHHYGRGSRNHPDLAAIELGRGCGHTCSFCTLWRQMGEHRNGNLAPRYRTKSPDRVIEEIKVLTKHFGRRYLGWVDPCFNAHPSVPRSVAERMLSAGMTLGQSAWVRADCLTRDHRSGALRESVASGLNEIYVGLERQDDDGMQYLNKQGRVDAAEILQVIAEEYPGVVTVGSFIYGIPGDTPEKVRVAFRAAHELPLDQLFFIPLTPLPGTPYWNSKHWDASGKYFRQFSFLPEPRSGTLGELTTALCGSVLTAWPPQRVWRFTKNIFSTDQRRRSISRHLTRRTFPFMLKAICSRPGTGERWMMRTPRWYES